MKPQLLTVLTVLTLAILACSLAGTQQPANSQAITTSVDQLPAGDPARGEKLFKGQEDEKVHCAACHSLTPNQTLVGPSLAGISTRAATRIVGKSAAAYIYQSIVDPNAYVVQGFHSGIMPEDFKNQLSEQEIADLLAFLKGQ